MKQAAKGALLSGTVFPGLGQIVLKHYVRGITLVLTVSVSLVVLVKIALAQALAILERIQWQGGVIDMSAISSAAARASRNKIRRRRAKKSSMVRHHSCSAAQTISSG
jgi:TM2 domain-containing membrane protein YozV